MFEHMNDASPSIQAVRHKLKCDTGAPCPVMLQSEHETYLIFTLNEDDALGAIRFERCSISKFGHPNDEVLSGHPLYAAGLRHYRIQQVNNSPWIAELIRVNSVHHRHDDSLFSDLNHYIFPFHDSTFECVATSFIEKKVPPRFTLTIENLSKLFAGAGS